MPTILGIILWAPLEMPLGNVTAWGSEAQPGRTTSGRDTRGEELVKVELDDLPDPSYLEVSAQTACCVLISDGRKVSTGEVCTGVEDTSVRDSWSSPSLSKLDSLEHGGRETHVHHTRCRGGSSWCQALVVTVPVQTASSMAG